MQWLEISKIAIENNCIEEYDPEYNCPVLDEDKLMDGMEEAMCSGGNIVDYHSSEFFPERWFDIVFVLRTNNTVLYDRLATRGYTGKKLEDNVACEIFQTILDETRNSYKPEIIHELQSNGEEDMNSNLNQICVWLQQWMANASSS